LHILHVFLNVLHFFVHLPHDDPLEDLNNEEEQSSNNAKLIEKYPKWRIHKKSFDKMFVVTILEESRTGWI